MPFTLEPGALALLALMGTLYARAVATLRRRGYDVPAVPAGRVVDRPLPHGRRADGTRWTRSRRTSCSAHMGQHLLIADMAAPFLLIGLRSPVYAFYLPRPLLVHLARLTWLRRAFRVLRRP